LKRWRNAAAVLSLLLVFGCGGSGDGGGDPEPPSVGSAPVTADISILFMGNSHSAYHDLPGMVVAMVRAAEAGKSVEAALAPGVLFLDERVHDPASLALLQGQRWSFVVLQAQKYSTSGRFTYSTAEAEELIRLARTAGAVPILFPEWPRVGIQETQRIYDLHVSIAGHEAACVAPIGQAWDLAFARNPGITLHDRDGNHSAASGAFLTALVLYATITGKSPLDVPMLAQFSVDPAMQEFLRGIADETVRMLPPRFWCPADPLP
jgi:hypothetical protein